MVEILRFAQDDGFFLVGNLWAGGLWRADLKVGQYITSEAVLEIGENC